MRFTNLLIRAIKLEVYFLTCWKSLRRLVFPFINLKKTLYQVNYQTLRQASYINESKELFKTSNILEAMVPQDSIPLDSGPLFFLIYINRLSHDLAWKIICRWNISIFRGNKYDQITQRLKKWPSQKRSLGIRKWALIKIRISRHKRLFLVENFRIPVTHVQFSVIIIFSLTES